MKEIQMYQFETTSIRTQMTDAGEVLFVASDVCEALALGDTSKACSRLDDDERGTNTVRTPSGDQQMLLITESGLYSLILTSRKPEAKRFKKWVTSEVLPNLRKTGAYGVSEAILNPMVERLMCVIERQADTMARMYDARQAAGESFDLTTAKASVRRAIIKKEIEAGGLDLDDFAAKTGLDRRRITSDIHVIRQSTPMATFRDGDRIRYTFSK